MPKAHRVMLTKSFTSANCRVRLEVMKWIDSLADDLSSNPEAAESIVGEIQEICNMVLDQVRNPENTLKYSDYLSHIDAVLTRVLKASIEINDKTLFADTYAFCVDKMEGTRIPQHPLFELVSPAIAKFTMPELLPM